VDVWNLGQIRVAEVTDQTYRSLRILGFSGGMRIALDLNPGHGDGGNAISCNCWDDFSRRLYFATLNCGNMSLAGHPTLGDETEWSTRHTHTTYWWQGNSEE
jgi:hypothetical protein